MLCAPEGETVEIAVLLPPDENTRVDALEPDQIFEATVTLLDFDTLYQRAVLGQVIEESKEVEPEEEALESTSPEVPPEADPPVETSAPQPPPKDEVQEQIPATKPPAPAATRPKPKARDPNRPRSRLPRSGKRKQTKLFRLKESLVKKVKKLKRASCPNGHGPLTYGHKGKRYCKVCGWPSHQSLLKPSRNREEEGFGKGCFRFVVGLFILFIIMRSCS